MKIAMFSVKNKLGAVSTHNASRGLIFSKEINFIKLIYKFVA